MMKTHSLSLLNVNDFLAFWSLSKFKLASSVLEAFFTMANMPVALGVFDFDSVYVPAFNSPRFHLMPFEGFLNDMEILPSSAMDTVLSPSEYGPYLKMFFDLYVSSNVTVPEAIAWLPPSTSTTVTTVPFAPVMTVESGVNDAQPSSAEHT